MKKIFGLLFAAMLGLSVSVADAAEPRVDVFSATWDAGSLVDAAGESKDVAAATAVVGDGCIASLGVDVVDMVVSCSVTAAKVATVRIQNESGSTADLASTTVRVFIFKKQ